MNGAELIAHERARQISDEGYTLEKDKEYEQSELLEAAVSYIAYAHQQEDEETDNEELRQNILDDFWPWEEESFKPSEDVKRNLEKAGALIAAELDRLS